MILHPLDVLESRLRNLAELPSKRNLQGIAQADLAIDVTRCFVLELLLREGNMRQILNAIGAVVADQIPSEEFRTLRWPQLQTLIAEQRRRYARRRQRQASRATRKS